MFQIQFRVVMAVITVFAASMVFAAIPKTVSYQGYVKDSATGVPVNGSVPMTFSLYSSNPARNDNYVWRETQPTVAVINGIYSTQLGSVTPISAPFDVPYLLGVNINDTGEMPLQPLTSVPYALRAQAADAVSLACTDDSVLVYRGSWQCGTVTTMPNAAGICAGGTCAVSACSQGFGNCDGQAANGCETNHSNDVNNCGGCGTVCTQPANATVICSSGLCGVPVCTAGWGNCDSLAANGCEMNIQNSVGNCGACGNVCSFPHAAAVCSNGGCAIGACDAGYYNIDNNSANGCEYQCTPTGLEICDGFDNNCDGIIDNVAGLNGMEQYHWYNDMDGDTYANLAAGVYACSAPTGFSDFACTGGSCTISYTGNLKNPDGTPYDGPATLSFSLVIEQQPTAYWQEIRTVNVTQGTYTLVLGAISPIPGYIHAEYADYRLAIGFYGSPAHQKIPYGIFINALTKSGFDCDDTYSNSNPSMPEICDGRDNNCDGEVDEGFDLSSDPNNCGGCGNVCGQNATCVFGACQGSFTCGDCDDGIDCTADSCDTFTGACVHSPNNGLCTDSNWCNGTETCNVSVGCVSGTPVSCNDANPCTVDICDPFSGCQFINVNDGTDCGSGLTCQDGMCTN